MMYEPPICPMFSMEQVEATETRWLWYPYIPRGKLTIIQGDPGEGKSTFALYLAAQITQGRSIEQPFRIERAPALVCYQNAEDGIADTVKPRLLRAGADCNMVLFTDESREPLSLTDGRIESIMRDHHVKLIILDPMQAYLGSDVDMHRANEIRPVMSYLASLAENYDCAVVLIGHMNKMQKTRSLYRGLGSIDLTAAARSVLLVARDPAHPENRVITQIKNSLAPEGKPVAFSLDEKGELVWLGEYEITLDEMLMQENRNPTARDHASELLREMFRDTGTLPARRIYDEAQSQGISRSALYRAREKLNIRIHKELGVSYWTLPRDTSE